MAQKKRIEHGLRARIARALEDTKEGIEDARERADDYVRDHPVQSMAIAAGVGALVAIGVSALVLRPHRKSFLDRLFDLF